MANLAHFTRHTGRKFANAYVLPALLAGIAFAVPLTVPADGNKLKDVNFFALPGNDVEVVLNFSGSIPEPARFTTDNPSRIVLDFQGTQLDTQKKNWSVSWGALRGISAVEAGGRTRVVLNLLQPAPFTLVREENQVVISIGALAEGAAAQAGSQAVPPASPQPVQQAAAAPDVFSEPSVQNIDFRRGHNGEGLIRITLSEPGIAVDMREEGQNIVIDFKETNLPEELDRRLDVTDFATPVMMIDSSQKENDAHMEISATGRFEHLAYQTENVYTIEVKQLSPKEKEKKIKLEDKIYKGQPLSLNFQNIDIHAVLNLIADYRGVNIITTDRVRGNVTLRLKNVPWDQALDLILDAKALGIRKIGNVWSIDLQSALDAREQEQLAARKKIAELEPLRTEFIQVNYSKAASFVALLKTTNEHSFLSKRGDVSVDERTNTLLVQDTSDKLEEIRKMITSLDRPVRQVLIAARVVIASDSFSRDLGVAFGQDTNYQMPGDIGVISSGRIEGDMYTGKDGEEGKFYPLIYDLSAGSVGGVPAAGISMAIGRVSSYLLQLELSAMEAESRGEIISSPRVVTADRQAASIKQGIDIVLRTLAGANSAGAIVFKSANLQLDVTPQITPDDRIIMDLNVTKDDPRSDGGFDTRSVKTQVLVDNGETVVLGGVYEKKDDKSVQRVPFFGDLPIVGKLFKKNFILTDKRELLIFVTPKILKETGS
ncbi:MAG: type IV pilus secretin PilQ [Gammaproteobacteria bacterium]|nr:type IV pilus secretin PilQ [Gammaproteobacteria bacterium]